MPFDRTRLNPDGSENLPADKNYVPSGLARPLTLAEQIQRIVRSYDFNKQAAAQGFETFDEAEDFDVGDEVDPTSPYEEHFDPVLGKAITADEFRRSEPLIRERYIKAQKDAHAQEDLAEALKPKARPPRKPADSAASSGESASKAGKE